MKTLSLLSCYHYSHHFQKLTVIIFSGYVLDHDSDLCLDVLVNYGNCRPVLFPSLSILLFLQFVLPVRKASLPSREDKHIPLKDCP